MKRCFSVNCAVTQMNKPDTVGVENLENKQMEFGCSVDVADVFTSFSWRTTTIRKCSEPLEISFSNCLTQNSLNVFEIHKYNFSVYTSEISNMSLNVIYSILHTVALQIL